MTKLYVLVQSYSKFDAFTRLTKGICDFKSIVLEINGVNLYKFVVSTIMSHIAS